MFSYQECAPKSPELIVYSQESIVRGAAPRRAKVISYIIHPLTFPYKGYLSFSDEILHKNMFDWALKCGQ
jgi:hypothetical protein